MVGYADEVSKARSEGYMQGWNEALDSAGYILADLLEIDERFGELVAVLNVLKLEIPK